MLNEQEWQKKIENIRKQTKPSTKKKLESVLVSAIKNSIPKKRFGIFFSGGVDSSLIAQVCKQQDADFICYTVGIKDSPDINWAKRVAKELDLSLKTKEFTLEQLEKLFKKTAKVLKSQNARVDTLTLGVGAVFVAVAELAKEDNITHFFSGIGSEEIFAGYERHVLADNKREECWKGLESIYKRDLTRDFAVANHFNLTLLLPFLEDKVIKEGMGIDISKKISETHKKVIVREIAQDLGLLKEFAWRKKQAAQYGSKFDKAIIKLTKQYGFENKLDWIATL